MSQRLNQEGSVVVVTRVIRGFVDVVLVVVRGCVGVVLVRDHQRGPWLAPPGGCFALIRKSNKKQFIKQFSVPSIKETVKEPVWSTLGPWSFRLLLPMLVQPRFGFSTIVTAGIHASHEVGAQVPCLQHVG